MGTALSGARVGTFSPDALLTIPAVEAEGWAEPAANWDEAGATSPGQGIWGKRPTQGG